MAAEYRIDYTVQRRMDPAEDFTDIGFGSSGGCGSPADAAYQVESAVQNWEWETEAGMPEPEDVREELERQREI